MDKTRILLIVDDDPAFLAAAEKAFGREQRVLVARNGEQLRMLIASVGAEISAVLIDLDLPGQDGFSLIQEMHANFPDLPVIAMSGVFQQHVLESAKVVGAAAALPKPITPEWVTEVARVRAQAANA
jgi:two-component system cell cycle sensor histidine kinase/response regulator CckA